MSYFLKLSNAKGKRRHLMILERNYRKILDFSAFERTKSLPKGAKLLI